MNQSNNNNNNNNNNILTIADVTTAVVNAVIETMICNTHNSMDTYPNCIISGAAIVAGAIMLFFFSFYTCICLHSILLYGI